jgi:hypothetical protein
MESVAAFLGGHRTLLEAHVVNFFKALVVSLRISGGGFCSFAECFGFAQVRMWELVDGVECLRREPVESLLKAATRMRLGMALYSACTTSTRRVLSFRV